MAFVFPLLPHFYCRERNSPSLYGQKTWLRTSHQLRLCWESVRVRPLVFRRDLLVMIIALLSDVMLTLLQDWHWAINNATARPVAPHCLGSKGFQVLESREPFLRCFLLIGSED